MSDHQDLFKRRDTVLAKARALAEKARDENREFTSDESAEVNAALAEAKRINLTLAADDRARGIMSQLDAMAASSSGGVLLNGAQRLSFGKAMADDAAAKILPPGTYGHLGL